MQSYRQILTTAMQRIADGTTAMLQEIEKQGDGIPRFTYMTGGYVVDPTYTPEEWKSFQWVGYLVGRLWLLADYTGQSHYADAAKRLVTKIRGHLAEQPAQFAAVGKDIYFGLCRGHDITGDESYRELALRALTQLDKLYNVDAGIFYQSSRGTGCVIDTANTLVGFYWASRFDERQAQHLNQHNRRLLEHGIIRPDGSSYQAVSVQGGAVRRYTVQGYADESTWARGQAWGIHNYTTAFEATGDQEFLRAATRLADWYIAHLPSDHIPYYDFDDPGEALPRDSCSAALVGNALCKLSKLSPALATRYRPAVEAMLTELVTNYLSPGGVLLHGSWGRIGRPDSPEIIGGKTPGRFPQEDIVPYGNYWLVEALYRETRDDWRLLRLR